MKIFKLDFSAFRDPKLMFVHTSIIIMFFISIFIVTKSYLSYSTIQQVGIIRRYEEMPELESFLCYEWDAIYPLTNYEKFDWNNSTLTNDLASLFNKSHNMDVINASVARNGIQVTLSADAMTQGRAKCWLIKQELSGVLVSEIYTLESRPRNNGRIYVSRYVKRKKYTVRISRHLVVPFEHYPLGELNTYYVELLKPPYSTRCRDYDLTRLDCNRLCLISRYYGDLGSEPDKDHCSSLCDADDCESILFFISKVYNPQWRKDTSMIGQFALGIFSIPSLGTTLYLQQVTGLVTMFFELMILDVRIMILKIFKLRFIRFGRSKRKLRRTRHRTKSFIFWAMVICCMGHIVKNTLQYMEYPINSETSIGKPAADTGSLSVAVCMFLRLNNMLEFKKGRDFNVSSISYTENSIGYQEISKNGIVCHVTHLAFNHTNLHRYSGYIFQIYVSRLMFLTTSISYDSNQYLWSTTQSIGIARRRTVSMETNLFFQSNLPHPYPSKCVEYAYEHQQMTEKMNHNFGSNLFDRILNIEPKPNSVQCEERFLSVVETHYRWDSTKSSIPGMEIQKPVNGVRNKLNAQQSFVDYVTFTASLLSLWLGLSSIQIVEYFTEIISTRITSCVTSSALKISVFVGFSLHLYSVINGYLSYDIVSMVTMSNMKSGYLPSTTFVLMPNEQAINQSQLKSNPPKIRSWEMSASNLNSYYFNANEIFSHAQLINFNDRRSAEWRIIDLNPIISEYIYNVMKIVTFRWREISVIESNNHLSEKYDWVKQSDNYYLKVFLNRARFKMINKVVDKQGIFSVYIHDHRYYMAPDMLARNINYNDISNDIYSTKLLKSPYSSRCIDYVDPLLTEHSFPSCMLRMHMKYHQKYPWDIPIPATSNIGRMKPDERITDECHHNTRKGYRCPIDYSFIDT